MRINVRLTSYDMSCLSSVFDRNMTNKVRNDVYILVFKWLKEKKKINCGEEEWVTRNTSRLTGDGCVKRGRPTSIHGGMERWNWKRKKRKSKTCIVCIERGNSASIFLPCMILRQCNFLLYAWNSFAYQIISLPETELPPTMNRCYPGLFSHSLLLLRAICDNVLYLGYSLSAIL